MLATARRNKLNKQIRVLTNDRATPSTTLHCLANVRMALKMTPGTLNLGVVKRDAESLTKTVLIERGDGGPISPEVRSASLKNMATELREIEPGEKYELDITVSPPWPNKWLRGTIALNTGVNEAVNQVLSVRAQIPPRLTASPSQITLPNEVEEETVRRAKLIWSDHEPGEITAVSVNDSSLSVELEEKDGEQWVVLHVPAGYEARPGSRKKVTLRTSDREVPKMDITVYSMRPRSARTAQPRKPRALPGGPTPQIFVKEAASVRAAKEQREQASPPPAAPEANKGNAGANTQ